LPIGSWSPANEAEVRRLPHANAGSDLVPQFVTSRNVTEPNTSAVYQWSTGYTLTAKSETMERLKKF